MTEHNSITEYPEEARLIPTEQSPPIIRRPDPVQPLPRKKEKVGTKKFKFGIKLSLPKFIQASVDLEYEVDFGEGKKDPLPTESSLEVIPAPSEPEPPKFDRSA